MISKWWIIYDWEKEKKNNNTFCHHRYGCRTFKQSHCCCKRQKWPINELNLGGNQSIYQNIRMLNAWSNVSFFSYFIGKEFSIRKHCMNRNVKFNAVFFFLFFFRAFSVEKAIRTIENISFWYLNVWSQMNVRPSHCTSLCSGLCNSNIVIASYFHHIICLFLVISTQSQFMYTHDRKASLKIKKNVRKLWRMV